MKSEPVSENRLSFDPGGEFFDSAMVSLSKRVQMV